MFSEDTARLSSILKLISSEHSDIWFDKCDFLTSCSISRISLRFKSIPDCQNEWHLISIHRPKLINRIYQPTGRASKQWQTKAFWQRDRSPAAACVPGKECNRVTLLAAVVVLGPEAGYWSGVRSLLPQPGHATFTTATAATASLSSSRRVVNAVILFC